MGKRERHYLHYVGINHFRIDCRGNDEIHRYLRNI